VLGGEEGEEGGSFNTGLITGGGLGTLIGVRDFIALATGCDIGKEGCLEFARGVVSCAKKMAAVSEMDMQRLLEQLVELGVGFEGEAETQWTNGLAQVDERYV
jgi:hypothetical protein